MEILKLARRWCGSAQEDRKNKKTPKDKKDPHARVTLKCFESDEFRPSCKSCDRVEGLGPRHVPQRATRRRRKRRRRCQRQLPPRRPELTPQDKKGKEQAKLLSLAMTHCASWRAAYRSQFEFEPRRTMACYQ